MKRIRNSAFIQVVLIVLISIYLPLASRESLSADEQAEGEDLYSEFEYFYITGEDSLVSVASLFVEDELVVGSTVSVITSQTWKMFGARRNHEALMNEISVITPTSAFGGYSVLIRGYASTVAYAGVSTLLDGVPLNEVIAGVASFHVQNWELGTLDKIEMIKGPGSSIYGSNAFHGVVSMETFESDRDIYSVEGAGAYPLYYDGNVKISQGLYNDTVRVNMAAALSNQDELDIPYEWNDSAADISGTGTREMAYSSRTGVVKMAVKPSKKVRVEAGGYATRYNSHGFPGMVTGKGLNLRDKDKADTDSLFFMGKGDINYIFSKNISVDLLGYYWVGSVNSEMNANSASTYLIQRQKADHAGSTLTIKQPDNKLNLQWLFAYSYNRDHVKSANIEVETRNGVGINIPKASQLYEGFGREVHSAFCQFKWGLIKKRFFVLAGARLDDYSDFGSQITPRGGLIYLLDDNSSVKALHGRAFRAAGAGAVKGVGTVSIPIAKGDPDIEPEVIDVFELIYIIKRDAWKLQAAGFYSNWKNAIIAEKDPSLLLNYVNKGENNSYGGELTIFYSYKKLSAVDLGFSYVESFALDATDESDPNTERNIKYSCFPTYTIHAGIYYTLIPLNLNFYLNNRIYLQVKEAPSTVIAYPDSLPPYYRLDLNISKSITDQLEFDLNIRNILNRDNYTPSFIGAENGYREPGISVLLKAGYKL